jgi:hypothetical protein
LLQNKHHKKLAYKKKSRGKKGKNEIGGPRNTDDYYLLMVHVYYHSHFSISKKYKFSVQVKKQSVPLKQNLSKMKKIDKAKKL